MPVPPVGAIIFAVVALLAAVPLRRPRALAMLSWITTLSIDELPVHFAGIVVLASVSDLVERPMSARTWWTFVLATSTVGLLGVVAGRAILASRVLRTALVEGLGREQPRTGGPQGKKFGADIGRARPWQRSWPKIIFLPWPVRPRSIERLRDIDYFDGDSSHRLDVYRHRSRPTGAPAFIHLHGGGFRTGRKSFECRVLLHRLAQRGWICISANYRLTRTPAEGFPDHLIDAKRVVAWARREGILLGIDPTTVVIAGSSAGAHLTTMVALTSGDPDLQPGFEDADTSVAAGGALYGYYGALGGADRSASSPLSHVHAEAPPLFLVHGVNDTYAPVAGARALIASLRSVSRQPVVYAELPGAQHSFDLFHSIRFESVVHAVNEFLDRMRSARSGPADGY